MKSSVLKILFILLMNYFCVVCGFDLIRSLLRFIDQGEKRLKREIIDQSVLLPEYDFVIVGAGK